MFSTRMRADSTRGEAESSKVAIERRDCFDSEDSLVWRCRKREMLSFSDVLSLIYCRTKRGGVSEMGMGRGAGHETYGDRVRRRHIRRVGADGIGVASSR